MPKSAQAPPLPPTIAPPAPPPAAADPCSEGMRSLSNQCKCPADTHLDAGSGRCVADVSAPVRANAPIKCEGGSPSGGQCLCPAGFTASDGICIRTHAENCLGGELTVTGACLCSGKVVMSGETYGLEYSNGKCVPQRCPLQSVLKDGKCVGTALTASRGESGTKSKARSPDEAEEEASHRHCGRGMIRTHSGCVAARRGYPIGVYGRVPSELRRYYRGYQPPGSSNAAPN